MEKLKIDKYFKRMQIRRNVHFQGIISSLKYRMAVVIPVYGEYAYIGKTLTSLTNNSSDFLKMTFVLLVINNPTEADGSSYIKQNLHLLRELHDGSFQRKFQLNNLNLAWIDASQYGDELPGKGGVGMARKLGMDSCLNYIDWNEDPIMISLDADTIVEKNYLESIDLFFNKYKDISAASIKFKHLPGKTPEEERAIREYEYSIRYYVDNLKKAGSPYAYNSIGSAMICRADAYIRAGGMKLHRGGEDFYFMQALRKLGPIMELTDTTVSPSARPSDRVPFGTGPKVRECLDGFEIKLYNPKIFNVLKDTLHKIESWINNYDVTEPKKVLDLLAHEANDYFNLLNFDIIWPKIYTNNVKEDSVLSIRGRNKLLWAFHVWFDAFKTLKFVHFLEKKYPELYSKVNIDYFKGE